jgi:hypothetical protein
MVRGGNDDETLEEYKLRVLWQEREARLETIQKDKGFNIKSLIATPERAGLTILFGAQAAVISPEVLQTLAKIFGIIK